MYRKVVNIRALNTAPTDRTVLKKIVKTSVFPKRKSIFLTIHNEEVLLVVKLVKFDHGGGYLRTESLLRDSPQLAAKSKREKQKIFFFLREKIKLIDAYRNALLPAPRFSSNCIHRWRHTTRRSTTWRTYASDYWLISARTLRIQSL